MSTMRRSFTELAAELGGSVGLAFVPLGTGGQVTTFGSLRSGVAWSTMKVPVGVATVREAKGDLGDSDAKLMRRAITQSDNEAAMQLWLRLGSPGTAAAKTQKVLRDSGDSSTVVPVTRRRAGYTPFGQSVWSLSDQATFLAALHCLNGSGPVLSLMGQVTASQRWGAGVLPGNEGLKGGWGPGTDGKYLVRQIAIVKMSSGQRIALAIAAQPANGSFETGVANLNALARWAARNVEAKKETAC